MLKNLGSNCKSLTSPRFTTETPDIVKKAEIEIDNAETRIHEAESLTNEQAAERQICEARQKIAQAKEQIAREVIKVINEWLKSNKTSEQIPDDIREAVIRDAADSLMKKNNKGQITSLVDNSAEGLKSILQDCVDNKEKSTINIARQLYNQLSNEKFVTALTRIKGSLENFKTQDVLAEIAKDSGTSKEVLTVQTQLVKILTIIEKLPLEQRKNFVTRLEKLSTKNEMLERSPLFFVTGKLNEEGLTDRSKEYDAELFSESKKYLLECKDLLFSVPKELSTEMASLLMEEFGTFAQIVVGKVKEEELPDLLKKTQLEQASKQLTEGKTGDALKTLIGENNLNQANGWLAKTAEFLQDTFGIDIAALMGLDKGWGNGWGKWGVGIGGGLLSILGLSFSSNQGKGLLSALGGIVLGGMASAFKPIRTAGGGAISFGKNPLQTGWANGWGKWRVTAIAGLTTAFGIGSSEDKSSSILTTFGSIAPGTAIGSSSNKVRRVVGIPTAR